MLILRACTVSLHFQTSEQLEVTLKLFALSISGNTLFLDKTSNILNHSFHRLNQPFLRYLLCLREIVGKGVV